MKISMLETESGLMIEPETEFETDYLRQYQGDSLKAFVKTGMDITNVVGLKIVQENES